MAVVVVIEAMRVVLLTLQPTVLLQTYVPMQKQTPVTIPRGGALGSTDVVTLDSSAAEAFELAVDAGVRDSATSPFGAEEERATLLDNDAAEAFELDVDPIEGSNTPPRGTGRGVMTELKLRVDNKQC